LREPTCETPLARATLERATLERATLERAALKRAALSGVVFSTGRIGLMENWKHWLIGSSKSGSFDIDIANLLV
jgi:uncharacterized protein YjbI with pentapeptide repeats